MSCCGRTVSHCMTGRGITESACCPNCEHDRVIKVAEIIDRRTGSHTGVSSWLTCAEEIVSHLDSEETTDLSRRRLQPGDLCQFFSGLNGRTYVRHIKCDQHRDGIVTDSFTGAVVEPREYENEMDNG